MCHFQPKPGMLFDKKHPISGQGRVTWRSPSNIAILKYWGKRGEQLPANPSVSFSLAKAFTETTLEYDYSPGSGGLSIDFYFEGAKTPGFSARIERYFRRVAEIYPALSDCRFRIESSNSFPHSSGIASSASALSALALCINNIFEEDTDEGFFERASYLARLGSGSAARSVYGGWTLWGGSPLVDSSSDEKAVPLSGRVHPAFENIRDSILIVSTGSKEVSSSAGHGLMNGHFYSEGRLKQASAHLKILLDDLQEGNWQEFIRISENEALSLHGLMMSSNPSFVLLKPGTLQIIQKIRYFREQFQIPVCFTLDAGPNVHLLYPGDEKERVRQFIQKDLVEFCESGQWIDDHLGVGPIKP